MNTQKTEEIIIEDLTPAKTVKGGDDTKQVCHQQSGHTVCEPLPNRLEPNRSTSSGSGSGSSSSSSGSEGSGSGSGA